MKFQASRSQFASAANDVARILVTKPPTPILNAVLVEAAEGEVTVTGYDFETCMRATLPAEVGEPGVALVPGRPLAAFLAAMPGGTVTIEESGRFQLSAPKVRYGLSSLAAEDYPALPATPPVIGTVDAVDLARTVARAAVAARPVAGAAWSELVRLVAEPDGLTIMATDRYTISRSTAEWQAGGPPEPLTFEVRARTLSDALRGMSGEVSLCVDDTGVALLSAERTVIARRSDVGYADVQRVLGTLSEPTVRMQVYAGELAESMVRAAKVTDQAVQLHCTSDGITITAADQSNTDLIGDVDVAGFDGPPLDVWVNALYLADALKTFGPAVVDVAFATSIKPMVITDPDRPGDVQLVMPQRAPGGAS